MARKAAQKKEVNNDGKELFEALKLLEAEKGIPVDFMIDKIKKAIATACKTATATRTLSSTWIRKTASLTCSCARRL